MPALELMLKGGDGISDPFASAMFENWTQNNPCRGSALKKRTTIPKKVLCLFGGGVTGDGAPASVFGNELGSLGQFSTQNQMCV